MAVTMSSQITRRKALQNALKIGGPVSLLMGISVYCRVPQLAVFAAASWLRGLFLSPMRPISPQATAAWGDVAATPHAQRAPNSRAVITYHPWYQNFTPSLVNACLSEIAALGATYVRSDVRWSDVLPDGQLPNETAFDWYRAYFEAARDWYGLRPIFVLSQPPAHVRNQAPTERLVSWQLYIAQVVSHLGDLCEIYQLTNEPNNPTYAIFDQQSLPRAISEAASFIREKVTDARILVNFVTDLWNWQNAIEQVLRSAGTSIDIIGLDHYPGTWTLGFQSDWDAIAQLVATVQHSTPGSLWHGRDLAILETGYSTNLGTLRGEQQQASFFRSFQEILPKLESGTAPFFSFVGIYELVDLDSGAFLDPEAHFGLLTSKLTRKAAFSVARDLCRSLTV